MLGRERVPGRFSENKGLPGGPLDKTKPVANGDWRNYFGHCL
jgi:hypothetical protein